MIIHHRSLHDDVAMMLREMITDGELQPGEKIVEQVLCERFGVSRTPLREALKVLAAEGLVDLLPRRGAIVAQITAAEIEELFPVMGALEALAGKLAMGRITSRDVDKLTKLHAKMMFCVERRDHKSYIKVNREIHETIFEISGNGTLISLYHQLLGKTHLVRFVARKTPLQWERAIQDHEKIMMAIEQGDATALGDILFEHMVETAAEIARTSLSVG